MRYILMSLKEAHHQFITNEHPEKKIGLVSCVSCDHGMCSSLVLFHIILCAFAHIMKFLSFTSCLKGTYSLCS